MKSVEGRRVSPISCRNSIPKKTSSQACKGKWIFLQEEKAAEGGSV